VKIEAVRHGDGYGIEISRDGEPSDLLIASPVTLEVLRDADGDSGHVRRITAVYTTATRSGDVLVGHAEVDGWRGRYTVTDTWTVDAGSAVVERHLRATTDAPEAVRLLLETTVVEGRVRFEDLQLFAPPALYDLNDIDGDGVEDYLDTRHLTFRDDRLTALSVLAYDPAEHVGFALSRRDLPEFDEIPERHRGQQNLVQRTDIGALGVEPDSSSGAVLVGAYPFVERSRSHALTAEGREPWGAFWPVPEAGTVDLSVAYEFGAFEAPSAVDCLWELWTTRMTALSPEPVELAESLEEITRLRLEALLYYYAESPANPEAAGFVTNCHPQDGLQLENLIQYGFTGQNVLNARHVLAHPAWSTDPDGRRKALKVVDFFVRQAEASPLGLTHTLVDLDTGRTANWWSGLVLPLAYAEDGQDLEALMGPIYDHMRYAIEPLGELDGTYLRCMAEEHWALLRAYEDELATGHEHPRWLRVAESFGRFLVAAQERDGSWRRAYGFDGEPITEPRAWFGQVDLNQKSSTATAVPFLVALHRITGGGEWLQAARRAERFAAEHFVADMKFNGGIHDSIYARAQLVDSESILFCMRASLHVWEQTGSEDVLKTAVDAARILATWIYLWDVPLPGGSTLARYGFRSTGWSACDTAGAGYIHPYEIHAAPELAALAQAVGDDALGRVSELVLVGSSETVATPTKDWGYARLGLQEEGLLVSWWLIDDPMFDGTGFGARGKGEGNKTCLPWISAVSIDAYDEMMRRFRTTDPFGSPGE